jgi:hypothetical protein
MNKKMISILLMSIMLIPSIAMVSAGGNNNPNKILGDPAFVLNVLGKKDDWAANGDFSNPDRHTIFVPQSTGAKIWITQAPRKSLEPFMVLDGNGFDEDGARIQLGDGYFAVYVVALGKPSTEPGSITGTLTDPTGTTDLMYLGGIDGNDIAPHGKQPVWGDYSSLFYITKAQMVEYLTYLGYGDYAADWASRIIAYFTEVGADRHWVDINPDPEVVTPGIWLFDFFDFITEVLPVWATEVEGLDASNLLEGQYYWDLKTNGIRHLQVRFYQIKSRDWDYFADTLI